MRVNLESLRQKAPRHRDPGGPISGFPDTTATVTLTESLLYCSGFVLDHAANGVARFRSSCNEHNSSNKAISQYLSLLYWSCEAELPEASSCSNAGPITRSIRRSILLVK